MPVAPRRARRAAPAIRGLLAEAFRLAAGRLTVTFDREQDGRVIASVPALPGLHVYGRTRAEAARRARREAAVALELAARG